MKYLLPALLTLILQTSNCIAMTTAPETYNYLRIPYPLEKQHTIQEPSIAPSKITITATKGSDLFTNADSSYQIDNAPRLIFAPKSDFIFSAKVSVDLEKSFDGAALIVYVDEGNWAKLLLERFNSGRNGIASTVAYEGGDDAYHIETQREYSYLKIARKGTTYFFYHSEDSRHWSYLRSFSLQISKSTRIGFLAQSPTGPKVQALFSDINFEEKNNYRLYAGNLTTRLSPRRKRFERTLITPFEIHSYDKRNFCHSYASRTTREMLVIKQSEPRVCLYQEDTQREADKILQAFPA